MESWPVEEAEIELSHDEVRKNLSGARAVMAGAGVDALFVSSADCHLNEYTPRADNHRFFLSGFTGSTAFLLIPVKGRAILYVDGRYHIQADQEVDPADIDVRKVSMGSQLLGEVLKDVEGVTTLGYEADRVSCHQASRLSQAASAVLALESGALDEVFGTTRLVHTRPIEFVDESIAGRSIAEKLKAVFARVEATKPAALLLCALDDIAWITDGRGYHFPYQSSFAGVGIATADGVHVAVTDELMPTAGVPSGVTFHVGTLADLLALPALDSVECIFYDSGSVTDGLMRQVSELRGGWEQLSGPSPLVQERAHKTEAELAHFDSMNLRASAAIADTIRWVRGQLSEGQAVTEAAFQAVANQNYEDHGARDLSFHTISGVGANSAIIHYSGADETVLADTNDLMLLDSGGLYEGGFCTDTTRTFIAGGAAATPSDEQKRIYTLVLKGVLSAMSASFPKGTRGSFLDALTRAPLYSAGLDYSHGTGHGVGIHVHEPGVGIGPQASGVIEAGMVCSIEPGYYREGWGGIRIENVVVFEEHPENDGYICSRPLNHVGFDVHLVDEALFTPDELRAYQNYQSVCATNGTLDMG